eukprot:5430276-Heterocapsa_arctica.AAC.1
MLFARIGGPGRWGFEPASGLWLIMHLSYADGLHGVAPFCRARRRASPWARSGRSGGARLAAEAAKAHMAGSGPGPGGPPPGRPC